MGCYQTRGVFVDTVREIWFLCATVEKPLDQCIDVRVYSSGMQKVRPSQLDLELVGTFTQSTSQVDKYWPLWIWSEPKKPKKLLDLPRSKGTACWLRLLTLPLTGFCLTWWCKALPCVSSLKSVLMCVTQNQGKNCSAGIKMKLHSFLSLVSSLLSSWEGYIWWLCQCKWWSPWVQLQFKRYFMPEWQIWWHP